MYVIPVLRKNHFANNMKDTSTKQIILFYKKVNSRKIQKRVVAIDRFIKNKTITKAIVRSRQDRLRPHRNDPIRPRDDQMCVLAHVCVRVR